MSSKEQIEARVKALEEKVAKMKNWKQKYETSEEERKKIAEELALKTDSEKGLKEEVESLKTRLGKFENLAQALSEILPQAPVATASPVTQAEPQKISLESSLTEITLQDKAPKEISMTTEKPTGKLMFCAVKLHEAMLKKDPETTPRFTGSELQQEAAEYGWQIPNRTLGGSLMVMCREGQLILDGDKTYRLPKNVPIKVQETTTE